MKVQEDRAVPSKVAGRARNALFGRILALAVTPVQRLLVVRLAVPAGERPATRCGTCGTALSFHRVGHSALLPAGRCGGCGGRLGAPPYLLELLTVVATTVAVLAAPTGPTMAAALWWVACAVPLVFVDVRVHRLPNVLTYPAAAGVLLILLVDSAVTGRWDAALRSAAAAVAFGAIFLLTALLLGNRGLGLGDVKLVVSIAALLGWWGWEVPFTAVFVAFLTAGATGAVLLVTGRIHRHEHIPMAPFLVAGALTALALLSGRTP